MGQLGLRIQEENIDFYIASLALGILVGVRDGVIPADVGMWSLGRPVFKEAIESSSVSISLKSALNEFDELDAARSLGLDVISIVNRLISELLDCQRHAIEKDESLLIEARYRE
ncbi:hypothetical protein [Serpens gallinarum]|uniref:Uncharacterized protein n=1 Tax=Serpens gallinarum TaxID=2763075 RepID=A0ABR8TLC2_9PSED|nr:hypothetical protein [Serpens gallinarum]MBD7976582.1 hypothetical protein [Serpens gallinarum]